MPYIQTDCIPERRKGGGGGGGGDISCVDFSLLNNLSLNFIETRMPFVIQRESSCLYHLNRTVFGCKCLCLALEIMSSNML